MKFTHFKHILALPTYGLTCPGFEWWALKKWKMEPGHPVLASKYDRNEQRIHYDQKFEIVISWNHNTYQKYNFDERKVQDTGLESRHH